MKFPFVLLIAGISGSFAGWQSNFEEVDSRLFIDLIKSALHANNH